MPHKKDESAESVMLAKWPELNEKYENKELEEKWQKIVALKEEVAKKLEEARAAKTIGHSLNAKVILTAEGKEYEFLKKVEKELVAVFIVSDLEVKEGAKDITIEVAQGEKCERCWMYSATVGEDAENPTICHRCSENLK